MEGEKKISISERGADKNVWDEYSILNDSDCEKGSVDKENSLEWKSFENGEGSFSRKLPESTKHDLNGNVSPVKRHKHGGEIEGRDSSVETLEVVEDRAKNTKLSDVREELSVVGRASEKGSPEGKGDILNISKQRYEEHMRKAKCMNGEHEPVKVLGENDEKGQEIQLKKEENMRRAIKMQEEEIQMKNQEILLLRERISRLEARMKIDGKEYVSECVLRGEEAIRILEEEIKKERSGFLKKIGEEMERSKMLMKRVDGLKKIINELVRKIKGMKQKTEGLRAEGRL
ncbi:hypothetical protein PFJ87_09g01310 [Encephalitozoon hellem]|uniref:Uncharacterized protein n=1 Tax=Encephalitozoon hellem TaxID=27973 RepID=A0ABY8CKV5_ENCHE|nr:hypothetical protein PFJ87_09g01310 [Encephalitozoon hellem]